MMKLPQLPLFSFSLPGLLMLIGSTVQAQSDTAADGSGNSIVTAVSIGLAAGLPYLVRSLRQINDQNKTNKAALKEQFAENKKDIGLLNARISQLEYELERKTREFTAEADKRALAEQNNTVLLAQVKGYSDANLLLTTQLKEANENNTRLIQRVDELDKKAIESALHYQQLEQKMAAHQSMEAFAAVLTEKFQDVVREIKRITSEQPAVVPKPAT